jgi:hypothetical protein
VQLAEAATDAINFFADILALLNTFRDLIKISVLTDRMINGDSQSRDGGRDAHNAQATDHGGCIARLGYRCRWERRTGEEICAAPCSTQVNTDLQEHGGSTVGAISAWRRDEKCPGKLPTLYADAA